MKPTFYEELLDLLALARNPCGMTHHDGCWCMRRQAAEVLLRSAEPPKEEHRRTLVALWADTESASAAGLALEAGIDALTLVSRDKPLPDYAVARAARRRDTKPPAPPRGGHDRRGWEPK